MFGQFTSLPEEVQARERMRQRERVAELEKNRQIKERVLKRWTAQHYLKREDGAKK